MKTIISQAENNERNLKITMIGYGHWIIECDYRGKRISTITTDSQAVDDFQSEFGEKMNGVNRRKRGYETLIDEIINSLS